MSAPPESYVADLPLRWGDMDSYGHINNVMYLRLLEEARIVAFADWFGETAGAEDIIGRGVFLAHQEIEYRRPLVYRREPLAVHMWVTRIGGASFAIGYEMRDPEAMGGTLYALAESVLATVDLASGTPRSLPREQRDVLRSLTGPEVGFRRRR